MSDDREATIATIALRQVRVPRSEVEGDKNANAMNRLVPYLDLFSRLSDEELSRLAQVPLTAVANLRAQVVQVDRALDRYADLLPRLDDGELVRLTGATVKTIRFWRLCQPRGMGPGASSNTTNPGTWSVARAAERLAHGGVGGPVDSSEGTIDSGVPLGRGSGEHPRHGRTPTGETTSPGFRPGGEGNPNRPPSNEGESRHGSGERARHPSGETPGVSAPRVPSVERTPVPYVMSDEERDGGPRRRSVVDAPAARSPAGPAGQGFAETAAAVAARARGTEIPRDAAEKHKVVAEQLGVSGAPFPGFDAESSGAHDDGIFIGLELPDPRTPTRFDRG